jgi:hypothetical protein
MTEAPTAAGEGEILILVEFEDESRCWIVVFPDGEGQLVATMTALRIGTDSEGWGAFDRWGDINQRFSVLGWIPAPKVTP